MTNVQVDAERPYQVTISNGCLGQASEYATGARAAVIHPAVMSDTAAHLAGLIEQNGSEVTLIEVPPSESAKSVAILSRCWDALAEFGMTRSDVVIGVGGGSTTDLAGFVAATWLRGVRYVSVPTTVLAMVDAAVGGKTGVNIPAGKNLVGAFHEPVAVLCDLDLIGALPAAEVSSGLAEVIKCGFIADPRILDLVEQDPADAQDVSSLRFAELVRRAVQVKATVVSDDLREATSRAGRIGRESLNYGHTLGHAIEAESGFEVRHGEAISIGMVFAAEFSRRILGLDPAVVQRHRDILSSVALPVRTTLNDWDRLRSRMSLDKKSRGSTLRLIGLSDVARVELVSDPAEAELEASFAEVAAG